MSKLHLGALGLASDPLIQGWALLTNSVSNRLCLCLRLITFPWREGTAVILSLLGEMLPAEWPRGLDQSVEGDFKKNFFLI